MQNGTQKIRKLILLSLASLSLTLGVAGADDSRSPSSIPPSAFKGLSAALKNWGLFNPKKSHINVVEAWDISKGSKDVVVAVIDTGLDAKHPSLKGNLWTDSEPKKGEAVYGWNFVDNTANPKDTNGHGTHVAGIIGAAPDKATGLAGVAPEVSIMALKYYNAEASGAVNLKNTVKAIEWAVKKGAKIINYSGGGPDFSEEEYLAIRKAEAAGVLFVAAAGNERSDADQVENYYYPSAYGLKNIISVAAHDVDNRLIRSSNWGKRKVDIAAPGDNIFSALPGSKVGYMTGTSQATAFVSGLAALLLSQNPKLTPEELKKLIIETATQVDTLKGKVASNGRLNALAALQKLKGRAPHLKQELIATRPLNLMETLSTP